MKEFWICLLLATAAGVNAQRNVDDDYDIYDENYDYLKDLFDKLPDDKADEYQIEDNRSDLQDDSDRDFKLLKDTEMTLDDSNEENNENSDETFNQNAKKTLEIADEYDFGGLDNNEEKKVESSEKDVGDGMDLEENQDEMKQESNSQSEEISHNDNDSSEDNVIEDNIKNSDEENDFSSDETEGEQNSVPEDIIKEAKQILGEIDDNFDEPINKEVSNKEIEEDNVENVQNDLEDDLKKLAETIDKLSVDLEPEEIPGGRFEPYYDNDDSVEAKQNENEEDDDDNDKDFSNSDDSAEANQNENEEDVDDDEKVFSNNDDSVESNQNENEEEVDDDDKEFSNSDDSVDQVADEDEKFDDNEELWRAVPEEKTQETKDSIEAKDSTQTVPTTTEKDFYNLSAEEYDRVMADFQTRNAAQLDVSNEMDRNIIPERVTLSLDEATIVTSPNYPSPYPTNSVKDWVFTGDGMGIELNITDFFVNGIVGDYLLIIPGGIDSSETDGLVFTYRLLEGRRYRFFDVDRMFVRFESNPGMAMARGFSFSAKMILPRMDRPEEIPEPVPVAPEATETLTLFIGGLTLPEFRSQQEAFRQIIADMATLYINANEIRPGTNATIDTTQITRTAACNVEWPGYEECTAVSFGVPLMYDEEIDDQRLNEGDLRAMWYLYSLDDPFAARLRRLGMTEFEVPNDSSILAVWAVIGAGVVVCMAVLAFALWRFSCLENYTRMPQYSDNDSVYSEKRGLDLYPTPHQTLPPLYADNEYKWDDGKFDDSARVDMGGFANKSYARDMYDIESDEDQVITPRDRNTSIAPREKFEV